MIAGSSGSMCDIESVCSMHEPSFSRGRLRMSYETLRNNRPKAVRVLRVPTVAILIGFLGATLVVSGCSSSKSGKQDASVAEQVVDGGASNEDAIREFESAVAAYDKEGGP